METKENYKSVNIYLNETTHKKAKLLCSIRGITFKQYATELIEKDINETDFNELIENEIN